MFCCKNNLIRDNDAESNWSNIKTALTNTSIDRQKPMLHLCWFHWFSWRFALGFCMSFQMVRLLFWSAKNFHLRRSRLWLPNNPGVTWNKHCEREREKSISVKETEQNVWPFGSICDWYTNLMRFALRSVVCMCVMLQVLMRCFFVLLLLNPNYYYEMVDKRERERKKNQRTNRRFGENKWHFWHAFRLPILRPN